MYSIANSFLRYEPKSYFGWAVCLRGDLHLATTIVEVGLFHIDVVHPVNPHNVEMRRNDDRGNFARIHDKSLFCHGREGSRCHPLCPHHFSCDWAMMRDVLPWRLSTLEDDRSKDQADDDHHHDLGQERFFRAPHQVHHMPAMP